MKTVESIFERILWSTRFVVLVAVVSSLVSSLVLFYMATSDVWDLTVHAAGYAFRGLDEAARLDLRNQTVTHVVEVVDGYLLATFLLIFGFGLYELFISDIDIAKGEKAASKILVIETLDDLKARLAKVVLMILIVRIFEQVLHLKVSSALELLMVAGCLVGIGLALWLSHLGEKREPT